MTADQLVTLAVLASVIAALIFEKGRADVVALCGAAVLLITGAVRPVEVQSAFASPAIIALASLFVIAYAMELAGLLDAAIHWGIGLCRRFGSKGLWLLIAMCGSASAFLNNTPIVVLSAPVVRDIAKAMNLHPQRFLMPLSYVVVLGGCCTLIGTSTNLLVNDMARLSGQPNFGIFEITPVGLWIAISGGLYIVLIGQRLLKGVVEDNDPKAYEADGEAGLAGAQLGTMSAFAPERSLKPLQAAISSGVFVAVIIAATLNIAPIAACAFAGAVLLIVLKVLTADQAYQGLRPDVLILIAGMVVLGIALEETGLAETATDWLVGSLDQLPPLWALIGLYGATLFLTELLSNATVAVLLTPIAVSLADELDASPRPFLVAVMMAGSAAFATPFGYQTNVLVYQMGGYNYVDFLKVGLPLNIVTWIVGVMAIQYYFPF